jgi:hypothetical protein
MNYQEGLLQQCAIAEGRNFTWDTQEKELVAWWLQQAEQMNNLSTVDGERLIILDSGKRNDGPGPDILGSRILLDDFEMSGDVEMHMAAEDWYVHGHHHDKRYDRVILHVILGGNKRPDIPTLQVRREQLGAGTCFSNRQATIGDLSALSLLRFKGKQHHVISLHNSSHGFSPLFLGMVEIIMAGDSRDKWLHRAANLMGMQAWPDCRPWVGSNLSYPKAVSKSLLLSRLMQSSPLFSPELWLSTPRESWSEKFIELKRVGLSLNQFLEWQVNILAPFLGVERGYKQWQRMKIFRHYGLEKQMLNRLGLPKISTVAEQQGVLAWKKIYCSAGTCSNCPLIQYHHALTHIN